VKIERSMRNEISAADVYKMVTDKGFQERKCVDAGALSYDVSVVHANERITIKAKRKMPTVGFPSLLRKFVPSGVTSTETIVWGPLAEDGSSEATLHVDFHGAPASMNGTIRLLPDGDSAATIVVDADFKAHVPLVGKKVEGFAAPIILEIIDAEEATGKAWAAGLR
jgi:Protein of unknown function (DUF2505)